MSPVPNSPTNTLDVDTTNNIEVNVDLSKLSVLPDPDSSFDFVVEESSVQLVVEDNPEINLVSVENSSDPVLFSVDNAVINLTVQDNPTTALITAQEAGPPGAPGRDGQAGRDGQNGKDGADGEPGPPGYTSVLDPVTVTVFDYSNIVIPIPLDCSLYSWFINGLMQLDMSILQATHCVIKPDEFELHPSDIVTVMYRVNRYT